MPNSFAYLVLALWPFVLLGFFRALPPGRAFIWSVFSSYLILPPAPTAFDFPLMPALDRTTIPNIMAIILVLTMTDQKIQWLPRHWIGKILVFVFLFSPVFTVLTNPEPVVFAMEALRGLYAQDIFAMVVMQAILLVNFTLAYNLLTTKEDLRDLLLAFVFAGIVYAFPMLLEVRLSPQINTWVYGYFQHMFDQMMRGDGFRPIVFLNHGIWAAMLAFMSLSAALILWKQETGPNRMPLLIAIGFLALTLVLAKTLSMLVYASLFAAVLLLTSWRLQIKVALVLVCLTVSYPIAKGLNLVPEERILQAAHSVSADRAQSLQFRFEQEGDLLERAQEKPLFGWGIWGRNQLHDPVTGRITSVSDGRWVITLGIMGWIGFLAEFGLLLMPIVLAFWVSRRVSSPNVQLSSSGKPVEQLSDVSPYLGGLSLLLALNIVDLLPNATLTTTTWLLVGAIWGYAEAFLYDGEEDKSSVPAAAPKVAARPRTIL